jgi:branched-chain amino acid transport system permease protein
MVQLLLNGLCTGSVYALVSLGFGLILFAGRTFHIAHGAVFTTGAYACFFFFVHLQVPLLASIVIALGIGVLVGIISELIVYRPLLDGRLHETASATAIMISSLGFYLVVVNLLALFFGAEAKTLLPDAKRTISIAENILTSVQIAQFITGVFCISLFWLFFRIIPLGRSLRAMADDPELLATMGYNSRKLRLHMFVVASALASLGGVLAALDVGMHPQDGFKVVLCAATAAIIGGKGSFLAPAAGAFTLSFLQSLVQWFTSAQWADGVVFVALIFVLILRPRGLQALTKRAEQL